MNTAEKINLFVNCKHKNVQDFTEYCFDCGQNIYTTPSEIAKSDAEQEKKENNKEKWNESGW